MGDRRGAGVQIVLGRVSAVFADLPATVLGDDLTYDEVWIDSRGLAPELAGLRSAVAGLTLDRLVILQQDAILRAPVPLDPALTLVPRPAATRADLFATDTPSAVSHRIEARLAAEGGVDEVLVDTVRRHELGHVRDARRLLPIGHHPLRGARAVRHVGVLTDGRRGAPRGAGRDHCGSSTRDDARAALSALLAFLPDTKGRNAHTAGYREAIDLAVRIIASDPEAFPSIRLDHNVVQQLDRLTSDEARELGRRLQTRY